MNNLIITDINKIKPTIEHKGKYYYIYFENISPDLMYFQFAKKWQAEEFLYNHKISKFTYKSSNGNIIEKEWEYIQDKIDKWKEWSYNKNKKLKDFSTDAWYCGHYIKIKEK